MCQESASFCSKEGWLKAEAKLKMVHIVLSILDDVHVLAYDTRDTKSVHCTEGYGIIRVDSTGEEMYAKRLSIKSSAAVTDW